jgi:hypothetical protein
MIDQKMIDGVEKEWNALVADLHAVSAPLPKDQMWVFALALESLLNQVQSVVDGE